MTDGPRAQGGGGTAPYRALICVTSCLRLGAVKAYLPHLARFCREDDRFALLVSHDGPGPEYSDFCERWGVALITSDVREGVGLSKNRVLERFGDFDFYFFLDDDVELVDGSVFTRHVRLAEVTGWHHFSLFERGGVRRPTGESTVDGLRVVHGLFGGGQFNFFTRRGLETVGGWHPRFAQYRRWGHTEHSHRFPRAGLAPAPFNVAEDLADSCIWHYPPPVTRVEDVATDADQLAPPERELLDQGLTHVPVRTLSAHHWNGIPPGGAGRLADLLVGSGRYPLLEGEERRHAWADYDLWRARTGRGPVGRAAALLRGALRWPSNPRLRHQLKQALRAGDAG